MAARLPKDCWLTAQGIRVKIKDMPDQHLINTLNYIEAYPVLYEDRANQYVTMLEEAKRRKLR